jgi:hypothetical protein
MLDRLPALVLALGLALAAGSGCFLDEIDKSMDAYENKPAKAPPAPAAGQAPAAPAAGGGAPAAPAGPSWWQTARTLGSEPIDDTIAACEIGGRVEFQRRDDCLARGGRPK